MHMSNWPYNFFGGKDFDDIGYHLIMDKGGVVYEGRQLEGSPGRVVSRSPKIGPVVKL
jgi:hypothetical protein